MRVAARCAVLLMGCILLGVGAPEHSAQAAFPGANGRIAFTESGRILSVKPDGSDLKQVTSAVQSPYGDSEPAWSPGGTMIAFARATSTQKREIWLMKADGTQQRRLTNDPADDVQPQWSPDGSRIVFASNREGDYDIYTMTLTGGSVQALTAETADEKDPAWSPDGTTIAYVKEARSEVGEGDSTCIADINLMDADGADQRTLLECPSWVSPYAENEACEFALSDPDWAPDGTRLVVDEECWGTPINWDMTGTDHIWYYPFWGYHDTAFSPSAEPGNVGEAAFIAQDEFGQYFDVQVGAAGTAGTVVVSGETRPWKHTGPDWQPIPAFPLVDARFSTFKADIEWVFGQGITLGCSAERYCPNDPVTREQMAIFLDRALDLPPTATDYFTDDEGLTGEASINRLRAANITSGCSATAYCPSDLVTRGQMASFLARAFNLPTTTTDYFTDDEGSTHEANINRIRAAGITTGCTATTYCPTASVTRGQMAAFLRRALD